ncbi:MAG: COX15/CtaA family protein [Phycisphaeraceae bacterium]|nr:COX15/CtaA family protein [Phycisphaeraceae bacterium]
MLSNPTILVLVALFAALAVLALASRVRVINLALGFGSAVGMWACGYAAMTAPGFIAGEIIFILSLLVIVAAGFIAARHGGPLASGMVVGLVCAAVNLLVVGGLLGGKPSISLLVERHGQREEIPLFVIEPEAGQAIELGLLLEAAPSGQISGLRVMAVAPRSSAENSHLQAGDLILRIDGHEAQSREQLAEAAHAALERGATTRTQGGPWIIGLFLVSGVLGWVGDRIGRRRSGTPLSNPAMLFACVAASAILLLLITGGLVTGMKAGLAVPDWPSSFGHNMLLYPLSAMTGGVYYEHAHRLFGMLVGVTTLVLVGVVFRSESRVSVRVLAIALLLAVVVQGLLGALRVTGGFSMSEHRADHEPSLVLGIVHGVMGQGILAGTVVLAAMLSSGWRRLPAAQAIPGGGTMRGFSIVLIALLIMQLILGACYRHLSVRPTEDAPGSGPLWALHGHITMAAVILILVLMTGFRAKAFGRDGRVPILPGLGRVLHAVVGVQILLGIGALVVVLTRRGPAIPSWEVIVTTAHQATGAVLLAVAALLAAWSWRLVRGSSATLPAVRAPSPASA